MTLPEPPVAGVIGWPIAHSKSPLIHRFWLEKLGLDGDYSRFPVTPERLADFVRAMPAMGLRGANVTIPHKIAVVDLLDELVWPVSPPTAAQPSNPGRPIPLGAINTIVISDGRLVGHNTDVEGFAAPLRRALAVLPVDRVATHYHLIGTGGAARAVFAALGSGEVTIYGRDRAKAAAIGGGFAESGDLVWDCFQPLNALVDTEWYREIAGTECDDRVSTRYSQVIINASSLGMVGQPPLEIDLSPYPDDTIVYDLVYAPLETPLLKAAQARGMTTIDGLAMLIGQAAEAFRLFFSAEAPRQHDAELRALLTR